MMFGDRDGMLKLLGEKWSPWPVKSISQAVLFLSFLSIHWADDGVVHDPAATALRIDQLVQEIAPQGEGSAEVDGYRLYHLGLPGLFRIGVHRSANSDEYVGLPDAGGVCVVGPGRNRELIRKKERLHRAFLARCEEWLLIYTFEAAISTTRVGREVSDKVFESFRAHDMVEKARRVFHPGVWDAFTSVLPHQITVDYLLRKHRSGLNVQ